MPHTPRKRLAPVTEIFPHCNYRWEQIATTIAGGISTQTLRRWRLDGKFPEPMKYGQVNLWRGSDLIAFIKGEYSQGSQGQQKSL